MVVGTDVEDGRLASAIEICKLVQCPHPQGWWKVTVNEWLCEAGLIGYSKEFRQMKQY